MIDRPVLIVGPPRSGAAALLASFARAPEVFTTGNDARRVFESIYELDPANRDWDGDRLTAADAQPRVVEELRDNLKASLRDRDGTRPGLDAAGLRWVDALPRNALQVPFLAAICPDAYFVYVHREPRDAVVGMIEAWRSGGYVSYPELPGWQGAPWSLPLVPGWRELSGMNLEEVVVEQWATIMRTLLDDLEGLAPERWCIADVGRLLEDPRREIERLCAFVQIESGEEVTLPMRALRDEVASGGATDGDFDGSLDALLRRTTPLADRSRELLARPEPTRRSTARRDSPLRSVYTQSFPDLLRQLSSSLLVSTYQTGKLILVRGDGGTVNTHFRDFERPMGLAVTPGRVAIGTRAEVLDYRDFPAVAPKIAPVGSHDACFLPRNRHYTGDVRIHEIAFAEGELWMVATNFSCLATLDAQHSFLPRWTPPFVTELGPEDRCHLNGLCVVDDRVRYVTALGESNEAGGWRETKASGGIVCDVESGDSVLRGLSMPHSPRWHEERLWLLESGKGTLAVADLDSGTVETVAELPGFTRGLVFAGGIAFVGLSQVREKATFGGIPLMDRLDERLCGVWAVDPRSGSTLGLLRFEELVQEIFDVVVLDGLRWPELAEEHSDAASQSFVLPEHRAAASGMA